MKFRGSDGRLLGDINLETHVFNKDVNPETDKIAKPSGWAIDVGTIDALDVLGCNEVRLVSLESGHVYVTAFENFKHHSTLIDSDYGQAIVVNDIFWQEKNLQ